MIEATSDKLEMAEAFLRSADVLELVYRGPDPSMGAQVLERVIDDQILPRKKVCHFLYAVIFELAIKIIWEAEKGIPCKRSHKILQLYTELSVQSRSTIRQMYGHQQLSLRRTAGTQQGRPMLIDDIAEFQSLEEALESNEDTIKNFKYHGNFQSQTPSSAIGSVIWTQDLIYTCPPHPEFLVFPKQLINYAKELLESQSA